MKKGTKIKTVYVDRGIIKAYTSDMTEIPINRSQRKALSDYNNPRYIENLSKEFSRKELLDEDFSIIKDGVLVYTLERGTK